MPRREIVGNVARIFQGDELVREHTFSGASVPQIVTNLCGAGIRAGAAIVGGEKVRVSPKERDRRLAICYGCEFYVNKRCVKCGCVARWKARLATEHCPLPVPLW